MSMFLSERMDPSIHDMSESVVPEAKPPPPLPGKWTPISAIGQLLNVFNASPCEFMLHAKTVGSHW
jgi:hypothetical protein